jgi:ABC-2 type transport system ATP-binding protein
MTQPVIARAVGVHRRFGHVTALDGIDLEVRAGITGLVGPNGAGKSTLIGLLLGLDRPDEGHTEILGSPSGSAAVRNQVGYAPEYDALPPDVRAQDLVRLIAEVHGLDRRTSIERATEVLVRLGLGEERFREIATLSTGQRQRVKLAQAVVHDPALVLLDEPTDGLDPVQRDQMLRLIAALTVELGLNVLISSHVLSDLERICDRLVVIAQGRVRGDRDLRAAAATDPEVLVRTVRPAEQVAATLAADGIEVHTTSPTSLVVAAPDHQVLDRIRDAVATHDVGLRSLGPAAASFEDTMLDEVGR